MRMTAIILCGVAAILLLLTTFTKGWYTHSEGEVKASMGLMASEVCFGGECKSDDHPPLDKVEKGKGQLIMMKVTLIVAPIAAIMLLVAAVLGLMGARPAKLFGWLGLGAAALALFSGAAVLISKPDSLKEISAGWGAYLYLLGAAAGGTGAILLALSSGAARAVGMPGQPQMAGYAPGAGYPPQGQPPMGAQPQPPACPRCRSVSVWVGQHQRWYCQSCSAYL